MKSSVYAVIKMSVYVVIEMIMYAVIKMISMFLIKEYVWWLRIINIIGYASVRGWWDTKAGYMIRSVNLLHLECQC